MCEEFVYEFTVSFCRSITKLSGIRVSQVIAWRQRNIIDEYHVNSTNRILSHINTTCKTEKYTETQTF